MRVTVHNKLVRDNIPEQIMSEGNVPHTSFLNEQSYFAELVKKMGEELQEYVESRSVEELADILEVFLALADMDGYCYRIIDDVREKKAQKNGRFTKRIFLETVDRLK